MRAVRSYTWRVQSIPASFSHNDLRHALEKCFPETDPKRRVVQLTLASDDELFSTGTVTFNEDPPEWVQKGSGSFPIVTTRGDVAELYFDKEFDGFTPLYTPPKEDRCAADIIAVPGLAGHALGSWKSSGGNSVWLRDFLPGVVRSARVLVYGYDSKLQQNIRHDTIRDLARTFYGDLKALQSNTLVREERLAVAASLLTSQVSDRPIILLGHSLGGLISITLACADLSPPGLRLFKRIFALMAFGAPNLGLRNQGLVTAVKGQLNEDFVRSIVVTSESEPTELLKTLNDHFLRSTKFQPIELMLCYERETSPLVEVDGNGKLVKSNRRAILVTEHSATFAGRQAEEHEQRAIAGDHSQMVKYSSRNDTDFKFIASVLKNWVADGLSIVQARLDPKRAMQQLTKHTLRSSGNVTAHGRAAQQTSDPLFDNESGAPATQPPETPAQMILETPSVPNEVKQAAVRSLCFEGMFFRRDNIKSAALDTCEWLSENDKFDNWIHGRSKLLWISGKPGAGKSVLMDYTVDFCTKLRGDDLLVLHFFFHGRGSELQHSATGLIRSLCHQLVCSNPHALERLARIYEQKCKQYGGTHWNWSQKDLKIFFELWITRADGQRKIVLVDALDEAGRETAIDLVNWFKSLISKEQESHDLGICFSCRHYPLIHVDQSSQIVVENCNSLDIKSWVSDQLNHLLTSLTTREVETITNTILSRAEGVFLWAALVVPKTVYLCLDGASLRQILDAINEVPVHLQQIYGLILDDTNGSDRELQSWLFTWLCFSPQLMSLEELSVALDFTIPDFNKRDYDYNRFKRKLRSVSHGLCEVTSEKKTIGKKESLKETYYEDTSLDSSPDVHLGEPPSYIVTRSGDPHPKRMKTSSGLTVRSGSSDINAGSMRYEEIQLIHQSVKDFFLLSGLGAIDPALQDGKGVEANSYHRLAQTCTAFLRKSVDSESSKDPGIPIFREYCRKNLHAYIGLADRRGIDQAPLLQAFQWPDTAPIMKLTDGDHKSIAELALKANATSLIAAIARLDWPKSLRRDTRRFGTDQIMRHICLGSDRFVDSVLKHPDFKVQNRGSYGDTYLTVAVKSLDFVTLESSLLNVKGPQAVSKMREPMLALRCILEHPDTNIDAIDEGSKFTALDLAEILHQTEAIDLIRRAKAKRGPSKKISLEESSAVV